MPNENCLEGWKCPKCGNEDEFRVIGTSIFTLVDDGTSEHGDVEYDEKSRAQCVKCERWATIGEFTGNPPPKEFLYLVVHQHRHGTTTAMFKSEKPLNRLKDLGLDDTGLAKLLELEFEPDREEFIEIILIDEDDDILFITPELAATAHEKQEETED